MVARLAHRKSELMAAAVKLVATGGQAAATIRAIASEAGVTEGAIYRHFRSKEELYWAAYKQIIEKMICEKQKLVAKKIPVKEKIRQWVQLTYEYYDRKPEAFSYALLATGCVPEAELEITHTQGKLFKSVYEAGVATGEVRPMNLDLALSHFAGVMLCVPQMVNEDALQGPASQYVEEVANAIWRVFAPTV